MLRVVRVGGSLLTWDRFLPTWKAWFQAQPTARDVLVAGGGPWVELQRQAARRFHIDDETAHWQCVKAMGLTAHLLAILLHVDMEEEIESLPSHPPGPVVFDVGSFLKADSKRANFALPANWDVTSDSIAAHVATALDADELVLLKSCSVPSPNLGPSPSSLRDAGIVDVHFPVAAKQLRKIRCINLRECAIS